VSRALLLIKSLDPGGAQRLLVDSARCSEGPIDYEVGYVLSGRDGLVPELERAGVGATCLAGRHPTSWLLKLHAHVSTNAIDLVHAHSPLPAVGARIVLRRTLPLVYTEHNVWTSYHPLTRWANALTFGRDDHVFAVSDAVRTSMGNGHKRRRVETLRHGLGAPLAPPAGNLRRELSIPAEAPIVCTVAEFRPEKGHRTLLEAADQVRFAMPDVRFVLIGDGPLQDAVRAYAQTLGLNGTVVFAGRRRDAAQVVGESDVFALPSLREGLPIAALEAMAQARAVVVTDAGGLPELVRNGRDGFVVKAGDSSALARAITDILRDPARRERLGKAAAERAAEFDLRRAVDRIEQVYGELLSR
jgi:glycosyltransferase involved in cell wall biosynthesis